MTAGAADGATAERPRLRRLEEFEPPVEQPGAAAYQPVLAPVRDVELVAAADDPAGPDAACRVLRAVVEVIAGLRGPQQLRPLLTDRPFALLTGLSGRRRAVTLRGVHTCQPASGVVEASVVYRHGERYRAIAARLERDDDASPWRCTVLRLC